MSTSCESRGWKYRQATAPRGLWDQVFQRPRGADSAAGRRLAKRGEKDGRVSYWLQPRDYEQVEYRDAWARIGRGDVEVPASVDARVDQS